MSTLARKVTKGLGHGNPITREVMRGPGSWIS